MGVSFGLGGVGAGEDVGVGSSVWIGDDVGVGEMTGEGKMMFFVVVPEITTLYSV